MKSVWTLRRFKSCSQRVRDLHGENLWQWSQLKVWLNTFHQSTIPQKQFIIIIIIIIIINWGRKMLAIFNTGKTQLASFKQPNNCSAIDMRILSTLYYVGALKLSQLLKLQQKKLEPWFVLSFFLLQLIIIWIILPHSFLWNVVVIWIALLATTWVC